MPPSPTTKLPTHIKAGGKTKIEANEYSIKTRMQVQSNAKKDDVTYYSSPLDAVRKIVQTEGILGLYTGIFGGLVGVASTNFAYFYWYTFVRDAYKRRQNIDGPLSTAMELLLGAVAGALAQIFTIPVSVCTTRQQTQLGQDKKGLIATAREVISEDGITGLWRGLKPSLVLVVNPAITYGLFERFKEVMYPDTVRLSPGQSFFVGAASKTVATVVTYPYIMAKVRMQFKPSSSGGEKKPDVEGGVVVDANEGSEFDRHDGAVTILRKVYAKYGFLGWYQVTLPLQFACVWVNVLGIEHTDFKGCFDAGDSVLLQGGVYSVHNPSHRVCSKTRLEECSARQMISDRGDAWDSIEWTVAHTCTVELECFRLLHAIIYISLASIRCREAISNQNYGSNREHNSDSLSPGHTCNPESNCTPTRPTELPLETLGGM